MLADSPEPFVVRGTQEKFGESKVTFAYGAITLFGRPFQGRSARQTFFVKLSPDLSGQIYLTTPIFLHLRVKKLVWALPFSLAATKGINYYSLFLRLLKCFTSAGSLLDLHRDNSILIKLSFLIGKSSDQRPLTASPKLIAGTPRPSSPYAS